MKAIASLLMLLVCMISFTGFSNTTTDLSENSSATEIHKDQAVQVVAAVSVSQELQVNLKKEPVDLTPVINDFEKAEKLKSTLVQSYAVAFTPEVYRSPRDGLNCSNE